MIFERARGAKIAELALHQVQHFFVRDVSRGGDHQMVGREPVAEALHEMSAVEAANGFRRAENGAAERMFWPEAARENVVKEIFGIVQIHLDFFEDDLALLLDVVGIELGTQNEIGDDVKGDGQMVIEDFGVEADLFFRSERVEHTAYRIHFAGDGFGGAAFGSFEDHVLDEMGQAVFFGDFAAGAVADPHADRDGANMRHSLGDDDEAVAEDVLLDVTDFCGGCHN